MFKLMKFSIPAVYSSNVFTSGGKEEMPWLHPQHRQKHRPDQPCKAFIDNPQSMKVAKQGQVVRSKFETERPHSSHLMRLANLYRCQALQ
jgi:hypothetical protein